MTMIRCNLSTPCTHAWGDMKSTGRVGVRLCPQCEQNVYWIDNYQGFQNAAQNNQCIAFDSPSVLLAGAPREDTREQQQISLRLIKQKLSLKQLEYIRQTVHPDLSLRQLRDAYHNKASIIRIDANCAEIDELVDTLRGVAIQFDTNTEEEGA